MKFSMWVSVVAVGLVACGGVADAPVEVEVVSTVSQPQSEMQAFADLALAIQSRPEDAAALLAASEMTQASFEAKIYEIAESPSLSAEFTEAMATGH